MSSNNITPTQRYATRSNSNSSNTTLSDIQTSIESCKSEILHNVKQEMQTLIENFKSEMLHAIKDEMKKFNNTLSSIVERLSELDNRHDQLTTRVSLLEDRINDTTPDKMLEELLDRSRREKNIIISGIEEPNTGTIEERKKHDEERTDAVLRCVGSSIDSVVDFRRLGKSGSSGARLLRVTFNSMDAKLTVLRSSKLLRENSGFKGVYINQDRTKMQQTKDKVLRDEVKRLKELGEDPVIFRGRIVDRSNRENFQGRF